MDTLLKEVRVGDSCPNSDCKGTLIFTRECKGATLHVKCSSNPWHYFRGASKEETKNYEKEEEIYDREVLGKTTFLELAQDTKSGDPCPAPGCSGKMFFLWDLGSLGLTCTHHPEGHWRPATKEEKREEIESSKQQKEE